MIRPATQPPVGSYLAALGRVDAIVFTAGVGENDHRTRAKCLEGLEGFDIAVDPARNAIRSRDERAISPDGAAVPVLVIPTDEELAIAEQTLAVVGIH